MDIAKKASTLFSQKICIDLSKLKNIAVINDTSEEFKGLAERFYSPHPSADPLHISPLGAMLFHANVLTSKTPDRDSEIKALELLNDTAPIDAIIIQANGTLQRLEESIIRVKILEHHGINPQVIIISASPEKILMNLYSTEIPHNLDKHNIVSRDSCIDEIVARTNMQPIYGLSHKNGVNEYSESHLFYSAANEIKQAFLANDGIQQAISIIRTSDAKFREEAIKHLLIN